MKFAVPDMSCGHCTAAIEKAVSAVDQSATIVCDLPTHTVTIDSTTPQDRLIDVLKAAGYDATPIS